MAVWIEQIRSLAWGWPTLTMILGVGLFLSLRLSFIPLRRIFLAFSLLFRSGHARDRAGDISPFLSLMTALSATIGTGNIAGVGSAIAIGGPGAVFWMWATALVGMATKYAEAVLAVRYRTQDKQGNHHGGPMYYIRNGLGARWRWLAGAFAVFGVFAAFGIGNTVQANSLAHVLKEHFDVSPWLTALALLLLVYSVVIGGIRRIGTVAGKVVPIMSLMYFALGVVILIVNHRYLPDAFALIFRGAFGDIDSVAGGATGYTVALAIRQGIARGVFSNEAGLGSAPIAHACSRTNDPVSQGLIATLGTFIDTIVVCSVTALIILTTDQWLARDAAGAPLLTGAALTLRSVVAAVGDGGGHLVVLALVLFAFTTILGWGVYGEKCLAYLFGPASVRPFRYVWALASPLGALVLLFGADDVRGVELVWKFSDILNAMMALPNLVALLLLSPVVVSVTRARFLAR